MGVARGEAAVRQVDAWFSERSPLEAVGREFGLIATAFIAEARATASEFPKELVRLFSSMPHGLLTLFDNATFTWATGTLREKFGVAVLPQAQKVAVDLTEATESEANMLTFSREQQETVVDAMLFELHQFIAEQLARISELVSEEQLLQELYNSSDMPVHEQARKEFKVAKENADKRLGFLSVEITKIKRRVAFAQEVISRFATPFLSVLDRLVAPLERVGELDASKAIPTDPIVAQPA